MTRRRESRTNRDESWAGPGLAALIVDDQEALGEALAARLAFSGFDSTVATTGGQALAVSAARRYDVAFVDLGLPDMDGIALAGQLKKPSPGLRVILMTGSAICFDDPGLRGDGIDSVLPKPWKPRELDAILRSVRGEGR